MSVVGFSINSLLSGSKLGTLGIFPNCFRQLDSFIILKKKFTTGSPKHLYVVCLLEYYAVHSHFMDKKAEVEGVVIYYLILISQLPTFVP